jgi:hypothetical protein
VEKKNENDTNHRVCPSASARSGFSSIWTTAMAIASSPCAAAAPLDTVLGELGDTPLTFNELTFFEEKSHV